MNIDSQEYIKLIKVHRKLKNRTICIKRHAVKTYNQQTRFNVNAVVYNSFH